MSNSRYLEFDSTYRDRNDWPNPGEFGIKYSMSGRKGQLDALDPVSTSVPVIQWTSNYFNRNVAGNIVYVAVEAGPGLTQPVTWATDVSTVIITSGTGGTYYFQEFDNYYTNAVLTLELAGGTTTVSRRIVAYKYLYTNAAGLNVSQVTVSPAFNDSVIDALAASRGWMTDPTDLTDLSNPYFFVPGGNYIPNGFCNNILYNETHNQYRPIKYYDSITGLVSLNTSGTTSNTTGPLPTTAGGTPIWTDTDNYSIRKTPPTVPQPAGTNPTVLATHTYNAVLYTTSTSTVIINNITGFPANFNFTNWAIRLIPNAALAGGTYYDYVSGVVTPAPLNQSVVIDTFLYDQPNGVLIATIISPPFTVTPTAGTYAELLQFSYDNCNPFIYTGSLVSQQENVCYEIKLINVILPNQILNSGSGGRIAYYPYLYVVISSEAVLRNIIYSNNPNSSRAIFRAPVYDISSPSVSSFVNLDGDSMVQTIKFKPNSNLYFAVILPNGDIFQTVITDTINPFKPNPLIQISACFEIKRVTNNPIGRELLVGEW